MVNKLILEAGFKVILMMKVISNKIAYNKTNIKINYNNHMIN